MTDYVQTSPNPNESTTRSYIPVSSIIYQQNNNIVINPIHNTETNYSAYNNYQNEIPFEKDVENIYDFKERKKLRNPNKKIFLCLAITIFIFILIDNIFLISYGLFFKVILIHLDELGMLIIGILYILRYNEKEKNLYLKCITAGLTIGVWFCGFALRGFEMGNNNKEFKSVIAVGGCFILLILRTLLLFFCVPFAMEK